jgi:hypothetical protein
MTDLEFLLPRAMGLWVAHPIRCETFEELPEKMEFLEYRDIDPVL